MEKEIEALSFEEALQELEGLVARLEAGELTLDESLTLFERGQKLAERCNKQLNQATLRIEQLTPDGEIIQLPPP